MAQANMTQPNSNTIPHETGYIPDVPDSRDFVFAKLMATGGVSPPSPDTPYDTVLWKPEIIGQPTLNLVDLSTNSPGVYDQGFSSQSCVGNAVAMAACYAEHKIPGEEGDRITGTGDKYFNPSRWWIWYHARRLDGFDSEHKNNGCSIRNAIKTLHQRGCPPDSTWPYPALNDWYRPDIPSDVLQAALKVDPDSNMYDLAKEYFKFDFEYYALKTKGLDWEGWTDGGNDPPAEASDRIVQMRTALAEGYPIIFAIGEYYIIDKQDRNNLSGRYNKVWGPMWDSTNFTVGNIEGGQPTYDVIMNDLDDGFFPVDNPKRYDIGYRQYGHVMIVIGSDPKRELFLVQNSYGLFDSMQRNVDAKPYLWMPYNYFRTRFIDACWVIRTGAKSGPQPPKPQPPQPLKQVTVNFSDNMSGANVNMTVYANVGPQYLPDLLAGTSFGTQGFLTSIQLKGASDGASVTLKRDGKVLGSVKAQGQDYTQFSRTPLVGTYVEATA